MSSGRGWSGGPAPYAGADMGSLGHPMCLIKGGSVWTFNLFHCLFGKAL